MGEKSRYLRCFLQAIYLPGEIICKIDHCFTEEDWELHSSATVWQEAFSESQAVSSLPVECAMTIISYH